MRGAAPKTASRFDGSWFHELLCWLLVGVGLLQFVGVVSGRNNIRALGLATAASPLPEVFGNNRHYEPMSHQNKLLFTLPDGSILERILMRRYSTNLARSPGHLYRFSPLAYGITWAPIIDPKLRESLVRKGFCQGGELARRLDVPKDVVKIRLVITHRRTGEERFTFEVSCAE